MEHKNASGINLLVGFSNKLCYTISFIWGQIKVKTVMDKILITVHCLGNLKNATRKIYSRLTL